MVLLTLFIFSVNVNGQIILNESIEVNYDYINNQETTGDYNYYFAQTIGNYFITKTGLKFYTLYDSSNNDGNIKIYEREEEQNYTQIQIKRDTIGGSIKGYIGYQHPFTFPFDDENKETYVCISSYGTSRDEEVCFTDKFNDRGFCVNFADLNGYITDTRISGFESVFKTSMSKITYTDWENNNKGFDCFTITNITKKGILEENLTGLDTISFVLYDSYTEQSFYIDRIEIFQEINEYPKITKFDWINENEICIDEDDENNQHILKYNISFENKEEDFENIYFADSEETTILSEFIIDYNLDLTCIPFLTCTKTIQTEFLNYVSNNQDDSNYCEIDLDKNDYDSKKHEIILFNDKTSNKLFPSKYMLEINGDCDGDDKLKYRLYSTGTDSFTYETIFYTSYFYKQANLMNFKLTDFKENEIIELEFRIENEKLQLRYMNESITSSWIDVSSLPEDNFQDFRFKLDLTEDNKLNLEFEDLETNTIERFFNISKYDNNNPVVYAIIDSLRNEEFIQDGYSWKGLENIPTIEKVNKEDYNNFIGSVVLYDEQKGLNNFKFYITDDFHLTPTKSYVIEEKTFQLRDCDDIEFINNFISSEKEINPNTKSEFFNELIIALRTPYKVMKELNFLSYGLFGIKIGILLLLWNLYKHQTLKLHKENEDVLRSIFQMLFVIVSILYVSYLIEKTWFTVFSILGLLYFSREILNITGTISTDNEKSSLYVVAMYSVLCFIWFGLFQISFGVNMGLETIPSNPSFSIGYILDLLGYFIDLIFFSIPDIPNFLNLINIFIRLIGLTSLGIIILNAVKLTGTKV